MAIPYHGEFGRRRGGNGWISDRSRVQSKVLQQISEFSQTLDVFERIPGAIFMVKDLDSRYIYMSILLREVIHQKSPEDVIGKTDFDFFSEDDCRELSPERIARFPSGQAARERSASDLHLLTVPAMVFFQQISSSGSCCFRGIESKLLTPDCIQNTICQ